MTMTTTSTTDAEDTPMSLRGTIPSIVTMTSRPVVEF